MKFAIANGTKVGATPAAKALCPHCESVLIAKCGAVKVWHWAHKGKLSCDPWWENETEWHRAWKDQFPLDWQEVIHRAESGEKHIADVKTDQGWVIEFQYSHLNAEERHARNAFYHPKLVWVVNGVRRKRDKSQFFKVWEDGSPLPVNFPMRSVFSDDCKLIREWADSCIPVFFDFGDVEMLWCLLPRSPSGRVYVGPLSRRRFIEFHRDKAIHNGQDFAGLLKTLKEIVSAVEISRHRNQVQYGLRQQLHNSRLRRRRGPGPRL